MTRYISFHNGNLDPRLLEAQAGVFAHFGYRLEQVQTDMPHGQAMTWWLNNNEWDTVYIFDADCIPLTPWVFEQEYTKYGMFVGTIQKANHIPNNGLYIAPAHMVLTRWIWAKVGWIGLADRYGHQGGSYDVGGLVTQAAIWAGIHLWPLIPVHSEVPRWHLFEGHTFGLGTSYADLNSGNPEPVLYHAFESNARHESTSRFLEKCKFVTGG